MPYAQVTHRRAAAAPPPPPPPVARRRSPLGKPSRPRPHVGLRRARSSQRLPTASPLMRSRTGPCVLGTWPWRRGCIFVSPHISPSLPRASPSPHAAATAADHTRAHATRCRYGRQLHYPFENKEYFEKTFPADFIAEGIDQTRGWFYTLTVLAAALFDKPAFKNLICNGLVLAEDGQKMSKRKKNYPPPEHIVNSYARDATVSPKPHDHHTPYPATQVRRRRAAAVPINSPVVRADNLGSRRRGEAGGADLFLPWYHATASSCARAQLHQTGTRSPPTRARARFQEHHGQVDPRRVQRPRRLRAQGDGGVPAVHRVPRLVEMVEQLTNWYLRMNKERFEGGRGEDERRDSPRSRSRC